MTGVETAVGIKIICINWCVTSLFSVYHMR